MIWLLLILVYGFLFCELNVRFLGFRNWFCYFIFFFCSLFWVFWGKFLNWCIGGGGMCWGLNFIMFCFIEIFNGLVFRNYVNLVVIMRLIIGKGVIFWFGNFLCEVFCFDFFCNSYYGLYVFNILLLRLGFDIFFRFKII